MPLEGLEQVIRNLNREVQGIKRRSVKGLLRAAILVRRDMDKTPPLIPVDTGNLRSSWFTTVISQDPPGLIMGFSANYAPFVHENTEATFNRPGAGAKFFEASLMRNTDEMLAAIAQEAKVRE